MKRIAIFGNAGGGKSTLARRIAQMRALPLYSLDLIDDAAEYEHYAQYLKAHDDLIERDAWVIDGFGCATSAWKRFEAADTLIHIDLPVLTHYRWISKRFIQGLRRLDTGLPATRPLWRSTVASFRDIPRCHRALTPRYRQVIAEAAVQKRAISLRSPQQIDAFLDSLKETMKAMEGPETAEVADATSEDIHAGKTAS